VLAGTLWVGDRTVMAISCFFVPEFIVLYRAEHKKIALYRTCLK